MLPGLESLCYPIMIVSTFPDDQPLPNVQSSLHTIELPDVSMTTSPKDAEFAVGHIKRLCDPASPFSGLKEIVLYGSTWRDSLGRFYFDEIMKDLAWKSVSIAFG